MISVHKNSLSSSNSGDSNQKTDDSLFFDSCKSIKTLNEESFLEELFFDSKTENDETYIIDVQKKKRIFKNFEERRKYKEDYQRKIKTELCKNWELRGNCKYGETCSFAHGKHELKEKNHLHTNYKTKPCQQYFLKGYCFYGYRCQYLHSELKHIPEFHSFLKEAYLIAKIENKKLTNYEPETKKIQNIAKLYEKSNNITDFFEKYEDYSSDRRLLYFSNPTLKK